MAVTFDRIGKLLVGAKLISEQQLREAVAIQKQKGGNHLSGTLVKMGFIEEDKLLSFLSQQYRIPAVNLNSYQFIDTSKLLEVKDYTINDLQSSADFDVHDEGATIDVEDFDKTVGDLLDSVEVAEDEQDSAYATGVVEAPIVKLVNGILVNALKTGSSDIHIEPYENVFRVRYRLDGNM